MSRSCDKTVRISKEMPMTNNMDALLNAAVITVDNAIRMPSDIIEELVEGLLEGQKVLTAERM